VTSGPEVRYATSLIGVDWAEMTATLAADDFDNGRTPEQLRASFENSCRSVIAYAADRIIGTARVLSDGICNAYVVDVWTLTLYRRRGIARQMLEILLEPLRGQHVALFTDEAPEFYRKVGFRERGITFEKVIGRWLDPDS
jgi:ribosomal protein S18 acetylase RimI-like enzyme